MRPPTVEPQTTSPMATARRFGGTRSAAAYRDRLVDELPNPIRKVPSRSSGKDRMTTADPATTAPTSADR